MIEKAGMGEYADRFARAAKSDETEDIPASGRLPRILGKDDFLKVDKKTAPTEYLEISNAVPSTPNYHALVLLGNGAATRQKATAGPMRLAIAKGVSKTQARRRLEVFKTEVEKNLTENLMKAKAKFLRRHIIEKLQNHNLQVENRTDLIDAMQQAARISDQKTLDFDIRGYNRFLNTVLNSMGGDRTFSQELIAEVAESFGKLIKINQWINFNVMNTRQRAASHALMKEAAASFRSPHKYFPTVQRMALKKVLKNDQFKLGLPNEEKITATDVFHVGRQVDVWPEFSLPLPENATSFESRYVSRNHGVIEVHPDGVMWVTDVGTFGKGSKNGTFINDPKSKKITPLKPHFALAGDKIYMSNKESFSLSDDHDPVEAHSDNDSVLETSGGYRLSSSIPLSQTSKLKRSHMPIEDTSLRILANKINGARDDETMQLDNKETLYLHPRSRTERRKSG